MEPIILAEAETPNMKPLGFSLSAFSFSQQLSSSEA